MTETNISNTDTEQQFGITLLLQHNPGLVITLTYLAISFLGLLFSWSLFGEFGVNIFNFTEVSDFLLAALREPMTFVMAASAMLVTWILGWFGRLEVKHWATRNPTTRFGKLYTRSSKAVAHHPITPLIIFVLYSYFFISLYGNWKAESIKAGVGQVIRVQLTEPIAGGGVDGQTGDNVVIEGILLGSTNKYLFLYDPDSKITSAMPEENIVRVLIDHASERDDNDKQTPITSPSKKNEPQGPEQ